MKTLTLFLSLVMFGLTCNATNDSHLFLNKMVDILLQGSVQMDFYLVSERKGNTLSIFFEDSKGCQVSSPIYTNGAAEKLDQLLASSEPKYKNPNTSLHPKLIEKIRAENTGYVKNNINGVSTFTFYNKEGHVLIYFGAFGVFVEDGLLQEQMKHIGFGNYENAVSIRSQNGCKNEPRSFLILDNFKKSVRDCKLIFEDGSSIVLELNNTSVEDITYYLVGKKLSDYEIYSEKGELLYKW